MKEIEFRPRAFLLGWMVGGVLIYPIAIVLLAALWGGLAVVFGSFYRSDMFRGVGIAGFLATAAVFLISGAVIGFCVGMVQRWLLRRYLSWTADHWRRYSAIGGAIGAGVAALVYGFARELMWRRIGYSSYSQPDTAAMVIMPLFIGVVSVLQWMTLRHAVRQSLLWVMANVVGGLIFSGMLWQSGPRMDPDYAWIVPFIAVLGQAFVTGTVMLWLFEKFSYPVQDDDMEPIPVSRGPRSVWDDAI